MKRYNALSVAPSPDGRYVEHDEIERLAKMPKVNQGRDYINCPLTGGAFKTTEMLLDLLSLVHGDGGHYIHKHGILRAFEDAKDIVVSLRAPPNA